jgi:hypothetical protein
LNLCDLVGAYGQREHHRCVSKQILLKFCDDVSLKFYEDRFPATAPTLADFLNWMPSTEAQDVGDAEEIQESTEAAFATAFQGILLPQRPLSLVYCA